MNTENMLQSCRLNLMVHNLLKRRRNKVTYWFGPLSHGKLGKRNEMAREAQWKIKIMKWEISIYQDREHVHLYTLQ